MKVKTIEQEDGMFDGITIDDIGDVPKEITKFYDKKHMCRIYGSMEVTKVTGSLDFTLRGLAPKCVQHWRETDNKDDKY